MQKKILTNLLIFSLCGILLSSVVIFTAQTYIAVNSANILLDSVLGEAENKAASNALYANNVNSLLKEDYLSRINALVAMIELDPEMIYDLGKLQETAAILNVDEIHIFDENGILRWGTQPNNYGLDLASDDQTSPFLEILTNPELVIIQDPMPNTAAGLMIQYSGAALRNQKGIAQIGSLPALLEITLENTKIEGVVSNISISGTGYLFSADPETGIITSHRNPDLIGTLLPKGFSDSGLADIDGQTVLYRTRLVQEQIVAAVLPITVMYEQRNFSTGFFLVFTMFLLSTFCNIVSSFIRKNVIVGIYGITNALEEITKGQLNKYVDIRSCEEFVKLSDGINHMLSSINTKINEIEALADSRERLTAIVAIADAGFIVKDKDGIVTEWNIGAENILGYKPEEMVGKTTHYYAPDKYHKGIDEIEARLAKGEHIAHVEVVRKHKDGRLVDCSVSYTPILDNDGEFTGSVAIFHDITSNKLSEKKARNLAGIVAMADAGFTVKDKDGIVIEWNIGAENIFGYKADEIIGKTAYHYTPDKYHTGIDEVEARLVRGEHITHIEVVRKHKDGRLVDCSVSYTPIFDNDGAFAGSVAIFHDITANKLSEKKARNLAGIVAMADAGFIVKDKNGVVTEWNIGAENILGYKPEEMIGKTTHYYASKENHKGIDEAEARLAKGEHIAHAEVIRKHKDGRLIDCSASYTPIFDNDGAFAGSVAIFHDITDKKHVELALKEAHETIISSIEYASKIQRNLLPWSAVLRQAFSDYSIIWQPRDVVGGDIYWIKNFDKGSVICVCDCTGHGTPGALLTMLVVSALEAVVNVYNCHDTAEIIWQLEQRLVTVFSVNSGERKKSDCDINDGCDLAVLFIAKDGNVTLSSGNTNVFVCNGKEVRRIKGQRIYIGEGQIDQKDSIKILHVPANSNNKFYIASDGLFDQPGGKQFLPFGYKRFEKIILKNHDEKQSVISKKVWTAFVAYMGKEPRVDDFELVTFKP